MLINGVLQLSVLETIIATILLTHITIASVTIFLHRSQAHRALDLHSTVSHFFRFWLWLTTGMVTREWVAIHRKHHAYCEGPEDPHSPKLFGIRKVLFEGAELYQSAASDRASVERYGHGTPDDWIEHRIYGRLTWQGLGLMALIDLLLFGINGIWVWALQMLWIPVLAAGVINGIGHYWGYRNFESPDESTNILPFGLLIGGEELHNNHHAFPSSAKLSVKPWEVDIGWFYIRILSSLGLARVKKLQPRSEVVRGKQVVDMDTLKAVIVSRMHVVACYAQEVVKPVSKAELCTTKRSCRAMYRHTQRLLIKERSRLEPAAQARLQTILDKNQALQTVYQFRERLVELWERSATNQEALLKRLQDWCQQAEASGIIALKEFSLKLRGLRLAT